MLGKLLMDKGKYLVRGKVGFGKNFWCVE